MMLALYQPTKTQIEMLERRRKFRSHIEEMAKRQPAVAPIPIMPAVPQAPPPSLRDWLFVATQADNTPPTMMKMIQLAVCRQFQLRRVDLLSTRRMHHLVFARHASMWLCKHFTGRSLPELGRMHGNRDHSTILHGIRKVDHLIAIGDPRMNAVLSLRVELEGYFNA